MPTAIVEHVIVVGSQDNEATADLVAAWSRGGLSVDWIDPGRALATATPHDLVIGRLDVLPTLDGVEPGLLALFLLERRGVRVVNRAAALVVAHDKLRTARALRDARLPQPETIVARQLSDVSLPPPVVLKPRFGSWGRHVVWCESIADVAEVLDSVAGYSWFVRHGVLVQEALPPVGYDLRLVVAAGRVVGCARRLAAPGEWRTNVSLGGTFEPLDPPPEASVLACAAVAAIGGDLVGVDLLPAPGGGYAVLEVNGAVEFDADCALGSGDVFVDVGRALGLPLGNFGRAVSRKARPLESSRLSVGARR